MPIFSQKMVEALLEGMDADTETFKAYAQEAVEEYYGKGYTFQKLWWDAENECINMEIVEDTSVTPTFPTEEQWGDSQTMREMIEKWWNEEAERREKRAAEIYNNAFTTAYVDEMAEPRGERRCDPERLQKQPDRSIVWDDNSVQWERVIGDDCREAWEDSHRDLPYFEDNTEWYPPNDTTDGDFIWQRDESEDNREQRPMPSARGYKNYCKYQHPISVCTLTKESEHDCQFDPTCSGVKCIWRIRMSQGEYRCDSCEAQREARK